MQGFPFRRSAPKVPTIHAKCAKTRKGIDIDTIIPKGDSRKEHFATSLPALPPNGPVGMRSLFQDKTCAPSTALQSDGEAGWRFSASCLELFCRPQSKYGSLT